MSFLKHSASSTAQPHHTLHEMIDELRHKVSDAVIGPHVPRCTVCHIELAPAEVTQGYCNDKDGCGCRAYSARCW
jgi:hypothetical protein